MILRCITYTMHYSCTLVNKNEMNKLYLSSESQWGLANVQVRLWGQQLWGNVVKKTQQQHIPVCVTLGLTLPACRPLRDKSAEIQARSFDVLLWWWALLHFAWRAKSPLVHVVFSAPPRYHFFLLFSSPPPSIWSIWSIARKPGNQSGWFLLGTTVLQFFCFFLVWSEFVVLILTEHKNWAQIIIIYVYIYINTPTHTYINVNKSNANQIKLLFL